VEGRKRVGGASHRDAGTDFGDVTESVDGSATNCVKWHKSVNGTGRRITRAKFSDITDTGRSTTNNIRRGELAIGATYRIDVALFVLVDKVVSAYTRLVRDSVCSNGLQRETGARIDCGNSGIIASVGDQLDWDTHVSVRSGTGIGIESGDERVAGM
jgi:hypothetical protein